jgi:hypothetical protein
MNAIHELCHQSSLLICFLSSSIHRMCACCRVCFISMKVVNNHSVIMLPCMCIIARNTVSRIHIRLHYSVGCIFNYSISEIFSVFSPYSEDIIYCDLFSNFRASKSHAFSQSISYPSLAVLISGPLCVDHHPYRRSIFLL